VSDYLLINTLQMSFVLVRKLAAYPIYVDSIENINGMKPFK